jgi:competence protein ComEC
MKKKRILLYVLTIVLCFSYILYTKIDSNQTTNQNDIKTLNDNENLQVHFIDVGQADATLITYGDHSMLIDGGNVEDGELISDYLTSQGIQELDYVIGTHPHEDHIGGLDSVIQKFKIQQIFMPDYKNSTDIFNEILKKLDDKNLTITKPVVGQKFNLGNANFIIIAPNSSDYSDNANNYSIGIKLKYQDTSFLMAGDAEELSEKEMLNNHIDLTADVYKVNHHGSYTSNSEPFLKAVDPTFAVISVGKENKYGHPNNEVLTRLIDDDVQIYRTDKNGTIIATSDGRNISFKLKKIVNDTNIATERDINLEVYITNKGTKYHRDECSYLNDSKSMLNLEDAKQRGYTPCSKCNPPE